jgi:hypothetical protein
MKREKIVVFARGEGETPPGPSVLLPGAAGVSDIFPRIVN